MFEMAVASLYLIKTAQGNLNCGSTGVGSGGGQGGMCPPPTFESGGGGKDMFVPPPPLSDPEFRPRHRAY